MGYRFIRTYAEQTGKEVQRVKKFNEEKFKEDYPDLYKKYSKYQEEKGSPGILTIKQQTRTQKDNYVRAFKEKEGEEKYEP